MQMTHNCTSRLYQEMFLKETAAITAMESCICWYQSVDAYDKFKLNLDKTECLLIGTRQQLQKVRNISILSIGDSQIAPSCEVRNLGTWFDLKMRMLSHINRTCSSAFYYLYNTIQYNTIQYNTIQYNTIQYSPCGVIQWQYNNIIYAELENI